MILYGRENMISINEENLEDLRTKPCLVLFWTPWCAPCHDLEQTLLEFEAEMPGTRIIKVNVEENLDLAVEFKIIFFPTVILLNQGKVIERKVGLPEASVLKRMMKFSTAASSC